MISVIIPVYNTASYLSECLDSVLLQTYKEYEVILIDDGSTDNSLEICSKYQRLYNNFSVYSQENSGQNAAVINGIKHSKGEYICFVDSDDWVEPSMLERLLDSAKKHNADCVICRTCRDNEVDKPSQLYMKREYYDRQLMIENIFPSLFCNLSGYEDTSVSNSRIAKLFKADIIQKIIPYMDFTVRHGEDSLLSKPYILACDNICFINDVLYHYRRNNGSISCNTKGYFDESIKVVSILKKASSELSSFDFNDQFQAMTINAGLYLYHQVIHQNKIGLELYDKIKKLCLDDRIISGKCPQKSNRYAQAEAKALNKRRTLVLFFLAIGRKLISN